MHISMPYCNWTRHSNLHASKDSTAKLENYSNYFATDLNENEMGPKKISWSEKYKLFPQGNCLFLSRAASKGPASCRKAQKVGSVTSEFNKFSIVEEIFILLIHLFTRKSFWKKQFKTNFDIFKFSKYLICSYDLKPQVIFQYASFERALLLLIRTTYVFV